MRHRLIAAVLILSVAPGLAGCAGPAPRGQKGILDFLQDGTTTKQEITLHLGAPGATYEKDRILTYRLGRDEAGYYALPNKTDWSGVCSNLILALGDNGVLRRHSLLQVGGCS